MEQGVKRSGISAIILLLVLGGCGSNSSRAGRAPVSAGPVVTPLAACTGFATSGDITASLTVDTLKRTYLLHVPPHLPAHHRYALVIMFHPASATGSAMAAISGMSDVADRHGFLVAYPDGLDETWLSGGADDEQITNQDPRLRGKGLADIHFIGRLIDAIGSRTCIDPARIYAGGASSGGSMAYRLACDLSGRIAAIAPGNGTYTYGGCRPSHAVAVIAFHGTANVGVPYHGGGLYHTPDIPTWASTWAHRDQCTRGPSIFLNRAVARAVRYTGCQGRTEVQLYAMIGVGDQWPYLPGVGGAAEIMWRFFAAHARR